jgi:hypothetical protein
MKQIPLTQGKFAIVDDCDFDHLIQFKWWFLDNNYGGYAVRRGEDGIVYMHRQIMQAKPGVEVEHRRGGGLVNTRENLRFATHQQNMMNRGTQKNNKSGHKGIRFDPERKKWQARIGLNRKTIHLGRFDRLDDAIAAHAKATLKLHGEFANLGN